MGTFFASSTPSSTTEKKTKIKKSTHKPSSGLLKQRKHKRMVRMLTKKIARWEQNKVDGKKANAKRAGRNAKKPQRLGGKVANRNTWNTSGLKKQLELVSRK